MTSMLMDRRMIVEEIGVTRALAEKIMRHCPTKHRIGRSEAVEAVERAVASGAGIEGLKAGAAL